MQSSIITNNQARSSIIGSELFIDDHLQISMFFNDDFYITIFRSAFDISLYKVLSHELITQLNHHIKDYRKVSIILVEHDNRQFEELRKSLIQIMNSSQISLKVSQYKYANYMVDRMYDFFEECDEANYVRSCSPFYNDEIKNYIFYRIGRCLNQQYMSYNPDLLRNLNIRTDEDSSIYSEFKSYFHTKKSKDQFTQQLLHPQSCSVNLLYFHERMKCVERNLSRKFICQLSQLIKQYHDIDQTLEKLQITPKISTTYTKLRSQVDAIIQIKELLQGAKYDPDQSDGLFEFKMFIQLESKGFKDLQNLLYNDIIDIRGEQNIQFNEYVYHQYGQLKQKKQQYLREVKQIADKFNNDQVLKHLNMRHKRWGQEYCLIISMKQKYIQDYQYYQDQYIEIQRIQKLAADEIEIFVTSEDLKYINQRYKNVNLQLEQEITLILESIKKIVKGHEGSLLIHLRELGHVDFYLGVLRLKCQFELIYPVFNNQEMIIEQARNVLVKKNVPNDLDMDPNHKVLLVLGPNASGKSVYIKTVGQLIYLAHCGFPIAAKFANICILQNMTTYFCGQMEGIVQKQQEYQFLKKYINKFAIQNSIFIIDEIGKCNYYFQIQFFYILDQNLSMGQAIQNALMEYQHKLKQRKRQPFLLMVSHIQDYLDLQYGYKIAEMECLPYDRLDQQFTQGQSYYTYQLIIKYQYEQYIEQNMFQAFKIHKNHKLYDMIKECYINQEKNLRELNKLREQIGYSRPNVSDYRQQLQSESQSKSYQQMSDQSQYIQDNPSDSEEMDAIRLQQLVDEQMRNNRNSYNDRTFSQIQLMEELNQKAQMIKQQRNQFNSSGSSQQSYYEEDYDQESQTQSYSSPEQSEYSIISDDSNEKIQYRPQQKTYNSQNDQYQKTRIDRMTRTDSEININYAKTSLDWYQEQRQTEFIQPNTQTNKNKLRQSQIIMYPKKLNSQK